MPANETSAEPDDPAAGVDDAALAGLLRDHWDDTMRRSPVWATSLGDRRFDAELPRTSQESIAEARVARTGFLARARAFNPTALTPRDATTLALFVEELAQSEASDVCNYELWALSARSNPAVDYNELVDVHPLDTPADGRALVSRYQQLARVTEEATARLRRGAEARYTPNRETLDLVVAQIEGQLAEEPATWGLASVVGKPRPGWTDEETRAFDADILAALSGPYRAALQTYVGTLKEVVAPGARGPSEVGVGALPNGAACYAAAVRSYTTLDDRDADAIHQIGLDEIARIQGELKALGQRVWGTDDLAAIHTRMRTDPELFFRTEAEVVARAEQAVADAKAAIPRAFGTLPQAECVVMPVPENEAPFTTIAYYRGPAADGSRPGIYYVNTLDPETRPRHEAAVLAYHESIPGHHLQIAVASEIEDLPAFRRHMGMTAFVEGWALYTERLADELGLYATDVDRLGMLSFDAWRAARLVVDTGLHHKGWTRDQAEAWMLENTPLAPNNIENEVDRYISWPGQALAYKTGQMHIWALRRRAEAELGDRFDLRGFHDVVLGGGAVTLPELTRRVDAWIAASR
jgi:uncharacterized protein (DUF885 family)